MVSPDMRTLIFSFLITDLIITIVMVILWIQNRKHFSGTIFWVANFTFQSIALALIALRGTVPDWISMVVSNTLVIAGNIMGLLGLEYFAGIRRKHIPNWILLAIFVTIHFWFGIVKPDLPARNLNLASAFLIIGLQVCWLVGVRLKGEMRRLTLSIGIIFMFYCLVNIGRIVNFFTTENPGNDYFKTNGFESFVLISYQMLFILLTYSLVMMFNKRLQLKVIKQEERYSKAFKSSPYAIIITRMSDGSILDINYGFTSITGYSKSESVGKTTNELGLWISEEDRMIIVNMLQRNEKVYEIELSFRIKSGELITGLLTSEILVLNDEINIFSSINDITDRKKAEEIIRESEKKYKMLLQNLQSGVVVHAPDSQIIFANEQASVLLGLSIDQMMGKTAIDPAWCFVEEGGVKMSIESYPVNRVLADHTPLSNLVLGINRPVTNDLIWVIVSGFPEFEADRVLQHVVVTFNDITFTKNLEIKLREKLIELEKFNKIMVTRELRMVELKQEVNELCSELKKPVRYNVGNGQ